ncbi:WD40/YVTN/BNR-like repeat-containing protein, partial [Candidatus Dependentiae bacterium]
NKVTLSSAMLPANYDLLMIGGAGGFGKSTDDGVSWQQISGIAAGLTAIKYNPVYENFILAVGFNFYDVISYDGGINWIERRFAVSGLDIYDVIFSPDGNYALKCGGSGRIYKTTDLANSWVRVNNTSGAFRGFVYSNQLKWIICVGGSGSIRRSENDGDNWVDSKVNVDTNIDLRAVTSNPINGTLLTVGDSATAYTSTNDGLHWKEYAIGGAETFRAVAYSPDGSCVIAVGNNGNIYKSTDDGQTWSVSNSIEGGGSVTGVLDSIQFSPDGRYVIVTNGSQYIYKSTNNGATWVQVDTGIAKDFNSVEFRPRGNYMSPIPAGQTYNQAVSNSIVFSDLQNGTDPDAEIFILSGSELDLDGKMYL